MFKKFNNKNCAKNKNTKEKLEGKLKLVRFSYNLSKILTVNFVPAFLFAFVQSMMSVIQSASQNKSYNECLVSSIMEFLGSAFFDILLIQVVLSIVVCFLYELMKRYKDELKKMDRAQSMPKKVGMRYIFR
ncbi:hypothetical protein [Gardnerella sp. KA00255]|uniref:hypothetical protein n=1 Tax=Gardnerella sp. KA00255 TaxID=2749073 RepID=UPI003BAB7CF6